MGGRREKGRNVGKLAQQRRWTVGSPEIFRWASLDGPIAQRRKILRPGFSAPFLPAPCTAQARHRKPCRALHCANSKSQVVSCSALRKLDIASRVVMGVKHCSDSEIVNRVSVAMALIVVNIADAGHDEDPDPFVDAGGREMKRSSCQ